MRLPRNSHFYIGFLVPLCIFLEAGSPIILASSRLADESLSLPLSFIALPVAMLFSTTRTRFRRTGAIAAMLPFSLLFLAVTLTIAFSQLVEGNFSPILYFVQWNIFILWLAYFHSLLDRSGLELFIHGFSCGTFFNAAYYLSAALLEIFIYGRLQDFGRMSQNLILPGQYQIAVYTPTVIAYSSLAVTAFKLSRKIGWSKATLLILNASSFAVILFSGAREALLVFLLGHLGIFAIQSAGRMIMTILAFAVALILIYVNIDSILNNFGTAELRMLSKIADLQNEGKALSGRDQMLLMALELFYRSPIWGTALMPPEVFGAQYGVRLPSAHNTYFDALMWTGIFGGIAFLLMSLTIIIFSVARIFQTFVHGLDYRMAAFFATFALILFAVSNNINVPFRQPITAPIFALFVALVDFRQRRSAD